MSTALSIADTNNPVSPDNLNTYEQTADTANDLRAFTGVTGMQVAIRGLSAVNDGGQGTFYWNAGLANPVDNNNTTIVPNGSVQGAWSRLITSLNAPIPTVIAGTNALILTPFPITPPVSAYTNFQLFTGITAAASTGNVTAQVGSLAALPVYLPTGVQAGSGSIGSGEFLMLAYVSSLNSGNGGFAIVNATPSGGFAPTANPAFTGTATLNAHGLLTEVIIQKFTGNATYTPTTGMVYCTIECWGAGAGGGGVAGSSSFGAAGGGGAGEYSRKTVPAATIGVSQVVTIGAGGSGGVAGNNNGTAGGNTSVGSICIAVGGTGGSGVAANGRAGGGAGGSGGTGDIVGVGQTGGVGINNGQGFSGGGGSTNIGGGGSPQGAAGTGTAGAGFGAGGAGAFDTTSTNQAGGAGTAGLVIITEYVSV